MARKTACKATGIERLVGAPEGVATPAPAPFVRLALGGCITSVKSGLGKAVPLPERPSLLVSYAVLGELRRARPHIAIRDWVMDSGAFSAFNSGKKIDLDAYIADCRELLACDPQLTEVFALDVIGGDWRDSVRNLERMWAHGVPAIPTFHYGEPWDVLISLARDYPKIALGGVARMHRNKKFAWAEQCFARVWPARIHGLGFGFDKHILGLPFHSTDSTSWVFGPAGYGRWVAFGRMRTRGAQNQNLRCEVEWYLKLERQARSRWQKEMQLLDEAKPL